MSRTVILGLSWILICGSMAYGQKPVIEPIRVASGTILSFHLQTRLNTNGSPVDSLPKGTTLLVKIQDSIDSQVNRDGSEFHGTVVSSVTSGTQVVVHPEAEVRGLLALLRSRSHPEGFRYELLITRLTDHGKTIALTASLNPSFADAPTVQTDLRAPDSKGASRSGEVPAIPVNP